MAVDSNGVINQVILGLAENVIGSVAWTCIILTLIVVIVALLSRIPVPFAFFIPLPLAVVWAAYGYMSILAAAVLAMAFLVAAVASLLLGIGAR